MTLRLLDWITNMPETHALALVLVILLLCGLGLPVPEEIPIIAAGYLSYLDVVSLPVAMVLTVSAVLIGDSALYLIGRKFGDRIFRIPPFRNLVTPARMRLANRYFLRWGSRVVFIARFVAGVRGTVFLTAGILKMRFRRFIALDGGAALISIPLNLWLVHKFGEEIDVAIKYVKRFGRTTLAIAVVLIVLVVVILYVRRRRTREIRKNLRAQIEKADAAEPALPAIPDSGPGHPD